MGDGSQHFAHCGGYGQVGDLGPRRERQPWAWTAFWRAPSERRSSVVAQSQRHVRSVTRNVQ